MDDLHPAIRRCPLPVGDLPDRSGYRRLVGAAGGPRRYVALTWGAGDEAELDDGRVSGTAPDGRPFLAFLHGPGLAWGAAHGLDFGSGDGPPARHGLVCDRLTGASWAMPWRWTSLLVRTQRSATLRRALAPEPPGDAAPGADPGH